MNRLFAGLMIAPFVLWLLVLVAVFLLGNVFGCQIGSTEFTGCEVFGYELGEDVYLIAMFAAWGPVMVSPLVAGIGVLWAIAASIAAFRNKKKRDA